MKIKKIERDMFTSCIYYHFRNPKFYLQFNNRWQTNTAIVIHNPQKNQFAQSAVHYAILNGNHINSYLKLKNLKQFLAYFIKNQKDLNLHTTYKINN